MREYIIKVMNDEPLSALKAGETIQAVMKTVGDCDELVRCKNCKHRPKKNEDEDEEYDGWGFGLSFPDRRCPCQCDDGWYNWMPPDDWFCGNGER